MQRREFGTGLLGIAGLLGAGTARGDGQSLGSTPGQRSAQSDQIERLLFPSSGALLDENMDPLTDDSLVAIWAEPTAVINDRDGNGDAVFYPDDVDIPVVTVDDSGSGAVAAIGSTLVDDGNLVPELTGDDPLGDLGNEEFLLNLYDEYADGETVLWDESHSQFYDIGSFQNFEFYAEQNGYDIQATQDLTADLADASAVVITSPSDAFSDGELSALSEFISNGGLVVCHNQSDFSDFDETQNFNDMLGSLGVGFRFNDAEVGDEANNVGIYYLPLTSNVNQDDYPLFQDREGITIDLQAGVEYDVNVVDVADGDTVDVVFSGEDIGLKTDYTGTVRILGIDTPESAGIAQTAERPEEWEGLAYDAGAVDPIDELVFDSTASLLDENMKPLTDDSLAVVSAEPSATNEDSDGSGDAVSYPDDAAIPLVAVDGSVAGLGSPFITDEELDVTADNEEFMLNVYDAVVGGDTVLWDEGHGQFYGLDSASQFESYAEEGYDLQATQDLTADISSANAVVITSPSEGFTPAELDALLNFISEGGAVILHDQSDFDNFDETANLNDIADTLGVGFRFNDDQVLDDESNTGPPFVPVTGNFDSADPLFETREGIDDDPDARTTEYLTDWASNATEFASDLDGQNVTLFFDQNEPLRDPTRLLAFIRYDATGDGTRDTLYNKQVIEEGYARAYGSSLSRHDAFWEAEWQARSENQGVWTESDLADADPYRDRAPTEIFVPVASSIRTAGSASIEDYANVFAEPTATQTDASDPSDGQIPLFGQDTDSRTAVCGSLLLDEGYERLEGFETDTAGYDNFSLVTGTINALTEGGELVYVDGGHDQFGTDYGLSSEDMAYYQRHLEGRQITLEQINDLTLDRLSDGHALVITTPASALTQAELNAVESFRDAGGAVVLLGSAAAPADAVAALNDVAATLGTPLRLNTDQVVDDSNNLADDGTLPTTTQIGPAALPGNGTVPQDVDNDGVYEDLNGDGELTLADVQLYFEEVVGNSSSAYVKNNRQYFDVAGDRSITLNDVEALYQQYNES
jgi:endonuclease YncB( thermonuclease family)